MIDLLDDLNQGVARSAACALGQIGRSEARPMLAKLLREEPSEQVIDAVSSIADEECMIQLGRIARTEPTLSEAALNALEGIDQPRANAIATAVRNVPPPQLCHRGVKRERSDEEWRSVFHRKSTKPWWIGINSLGKS